MIFIFHRWIGRHKCNQRYFLYDDWNVRNCQYGIATLDYIVGKSKE